MGWDDEKKCEERDRLIYYRLISVYVGLARTVYIYTVYDRIFGGFLATINTVCTLYNMVLANPVYLQKMHGRERHDKGL
jgi:hypothetical protein